MKKARTWIVLAAIVVAVFIPTYIAIISYAVINSLPEPLNVDKYAISIVSPSGEVLDLSGKDGDSIKSAFLTMRRDAVKAEGEVDVSGTFSYSAVITGEGETGEYEFLLNPGGGGYMRSGGVTYKLTHGSVKPFLLTLYAADMYQYSEFPVLRTSRSDVIAPTKGQWKYAACDGEYVDVSVPTSAGGLSYYHAGHIGLEFSVDPDRINVSVKDENGEEYNSFVDNQSRMLEYRLYVEWSGGEYVGSAEYYFFANIGLPVECGVKAGVSDGKYTDFLVVFANNVTESKQLKLEFSPSVDVNVEFFTSGGNSFAVVPISRRMSDGKYEVSVIYNGTAYDAGEVSVQKRPVSSASNKYPAKDGVDTEQLYGVFLDLVKQVCASNESKLYASGTFADPEGRDDGTTLLIGYGREVSVEGSDLSYVTDGVEYYASGGVYAINTGKVVKTGNDGWLGNYIVVDHGLGVKSWYCHLSGIDVSLGQTVKKNEIVGTAAKTGYTPNSKTGFYLIVTANGVPISPYALFETDLTAQADN